MWKIRIITPSPDHTTLVGVGADDHHAIQHAIDSGLVHTGDITDTQHGIRATANAHAHSATSGQGINDHHNEVHAHSLHSGVGVNDHHNQAHSLASHSSEAHAELSGVGVNDHHNQSHTIVSHSDGSDVARIATGFYTGDGGTSQGITGIGFAPKWVWITKRITTDLTTVVTNEVMYTSDVIVDDNAAGQALDMSSQLSTMTPRTRHNAIISLDADGFTVDDGAADQDPNENNTVYNFLALG